MNEAKQLSKFAIVSHVLPPSPSGQATVLGKLLDGTDPASYCLISGQRLARAYPTSTNVQKATEARYYLDRDFFRWGPFGRSPLLEAMALLAVVVRAWKVWRIARREACKAIVACSGDLIDIPASYLASLIGGMDFYAYLFDDYVYQWSDPGSRRFAELIADQTMGRASGAVTPNEFLQTAYRERYGLECTVVRNPGFETVLDDWDDSRSMDSSEFRIIYTGAVYHAHFDSFIRLISAIDELLRSDARLHLYTYQSQEDLHSAGLSGAMIIHGHLAFDEIAAVQQTADILFLPLAFNSPIPEVVRTSAPGKMGEYLGSGRPILVHAPKDSFLAWYFRKHECGLVVDRPEVKALANGIEQLRSDSALREKLARRALRHAKSEFAPSSARDRFFKLVSGANRSS